MFGIQHRSNTGATDEKREMGHPTRRGTLYPNLRRTALYLPSKPMLALSERPHQPIQVLRRLISTQEIKRA